MLDEMNGRTKQDCDIANVLNVFEDITDTHFDCKNCPCRFDCEDAKKINRNKTI